MSDPRPTTREGRRLLPLERRLPLLAARLRELGQRVHAGTEHRERLCRARLREDLFALLQDLRDNRVMARVLLARIEEDERAIVRALAALAE